MKKQFGIYRRLARGLFGCSSLWAGPDHLVYVKGAGFLIPFTEEYRRFRYRDIQAITMAPTTMYGWTSTLFGLGAASGAAIVFLPDYPAPVRVVLAVLLLPFMAACLTCFIATIARGRSCRCRIQTAVGSVDIRPLTRVRAARRAIETMSALAAAEQGQGEPAAPEAAGSSLEENPVAVPPPRSIPAPPSPSGIARSGRMTRSRFLLPTMGAMAPFGILWLVHAYSTGWWALAAVGVIELVLFLGVSASLVEQMRGFTPSSILAVLWASMAQQVLLLVAALAAYTLWSIDSGAVGVEGSPISLESIYVRAETSGFVYAFSMFNGVGSLLLSAAGMSLVWRFRSRMAGGARPPALPPMQPADSAAPGRGRSGGAVDE